MYRFIKLVLTKIALPAEKEDLITTYKNVQKGVKQGEEKDVNISAIKPALGTVLCSVEARIVPADVTVLAITSINSEQVRNRE